MVQNWLDLKRMCTIHFLLDPSQRRFTYESICLLLEYRIESRFPLSHYIQASRLSTLPTLHLKLVSGRSKKLAKSKQFSEKFSAGERNACSTALP